LSGPAWLRRLSALWRRPRRIEGFVDGLYGGEIRGWALIPGEPGRRVHIVALCEGEVVAEALADIPRTDLLQDGRGDGRHGFRLRLPAGLLDGSPRKLRVEAAVGGARERLLRSEVEIRPSEPPPPAPAASTPATARASAASQERVSLVIWDSDGAGAAEASWAAQDWPDCAAIRIGAADADENRLRALFAASHTVVFARAADALDPAAARLLAQARPLGDVVTWVGRPEARALGVLLGESLGGAFAVRGHVLASLPGPWPGLRRLELWLAARRELRWASLAAPLSAGAADGASPPILAEDATGLEGLLFRDADDEAPARLVPARTARRISFAAWPTSGPEARATLSAFLARAPQTAEIELLAGAGELDALRQLVADGGGRVSLRPVDPPGSGGAGAWMRALSEAASGEVVALARAGLQLDCSAQRLEELAAWALHPCAGAATLEIDTPAGRLGGLGLARAGAGWRTGPAETSPRGANGRPALAAPAALLAVARARLAAMGGFDDLRFPAGGADLDLGLRMRRAGWTSLVLAGPGARGPAEPLSQGAGLAAFEAQELAAAALAFPAAGKE
jgi:hypothetical protein